MSSEKRLNRLAKNLRRRMTDAERKLWHRMRNKQLGVKFRRQQPISQYIVDFVCFEKKIIIEIDGGEHFGDKSDEVRDKWFKNQGYQVLRFWNNDVLVNPEGVLEAIMEKLSPFPLSPPIKGEERMCGGN